MIRKTSLRYSHKASKDLEKIGNVLANRILKKIEQNVDKGIPPLSKNLKGSLRGLGRFRIGKYRAIFKYDEVSNTIIILKIKHRKDIYKKINSELSI